MSGDVDSQLGLLQELEHILGGAKIRFWLRGGWALDFLLGEVTRAHADIDLLTWGRHRPRLRRVLEEHGYEGLPASNSKGQQVFRRQSEDVSFVFVERRQDGVLVTPGFEHWPWSTSALSGPTRTLAGITCRVISPEELLAEKEEYEAMEGRPPRPKDEISIGRLRELLRR